MPSPPHRTGVPERRERLNRQRVLHGAIDLADTIGLPALSMRRLAGALGVAPMALYKHVSDKEDLLDGMVDVVIDRFEAPPPGLDWRDEARNRILEARRVVMAHPWARQAIESRTHRTVTVLGHLDAVTAAFLRGGLSPQLTHHVMHAIGNRVWGFSPEMFNPPADDEARPAAPPDDTTLAEFAARFPAIASVAGAATAGDPARLVAGCDEDFEFRFALDLLLDGADRLHRSGAWTP